MSGLVSALFGFIALIALFAAAVLLLALRVTCVTDGDSAETSVPAPR